MIIPWSGHMFTIFIMTCYQILWLFHITLRHLIMSCVSMICYSKCSLLYLGKWKILIQQHLDTAKCVVITGLGSNTFYQIQIQIHFFSGVSNTNTNTNTPAKIWSNTNTNTNTAHQIQIQIQIQIHNEAETKLPPFYRWHIEIYCFVRRLFIHSNFTENCFQRSNLQ